METIEPDTYSQTKKIICDWSDKKNYLVHYRIMKFYVRHGMAVEKFRIVISSHKCKWLEKYIIFYTQKRNKAKSEFEKDFYKLFYNAFYEKKWKMFIIDVKENLFKKMIKKKLSDINLN